MGKKSARIDDLTDAAVDATNLIDKDLRDAFTKIKIQQATGVFESLTGVNMGKGFTYTNSSGKEINIFKDIQIRTKDGKKEFQRIIKNKKGEVKYESIPDEMIQKALANGYTAMARKLRSIN